MIPAGLSLAAARAAVIRLGHGNGNDIVITSSGLGPSQLILGNGNDAITLAGLLNGVTLGNSKDSVAGGTGAATIALGTGSSVVSTSAFGSSITIGSGAAAADTITVANGGLKSVKAGLGVEKVTLSGTGKS